MTYYTVIITKRSIIMTLNDEFIGEKIRNIRKLNNLTQDKFAGKMHITQQTLSRYEKGATSIPYKLLSGISIEFQVPISYFFGIDTEELSQEEYLLVEYYRNIDDVLKEKVLDLIKTLANDFHK